MIVRRVAALTLSALRRQHSGHCWPSSFTPMCTLHADEGTNGGFGENQPCCSVFRSRRLPLACIRRAKGPTA